MNYHPYRSAPTAAPITNTVKIETNDVEVKIYYLDLDNKMTEESISFIGRPYARNRTDHIYEYEGKGTIDFNEWLRTSHARGCYQINDAFIPTHRLLKIERSIKDRIEEVEISNL